MQCRWGSSWDAFYMGASNTLKSRCIYVYRWENYGRGNHYSYLFWWGNNNIHNDRNDTFFNSRRWIKELYWTRDYIIMVYNRHVCSQMSVCALFRVDYSSISLITYSTNSGLRIMLLILSSAVKKHMVYILLWKLNWLAVSVSIDYKIAKL